MMRHAIVRQSNGKADRRGADSGPAGFTHIHQRLAWCTVVVTAFRMKKSLLQVGPVLWQLHRVPGGPHGDPHVHMLPSVPTMVRTSTLQMYRSFKALFKLTPGQTFSFTCSWRPRLSCSLPWHFRSS